MSIKYSSIGLISLLLIGCSSPEEQAARRDAIDKGDQAECLGLGFKLNTDAYGNCRLKLREIRAQERAARNSHIYPSIGVGYSHHRW